MDHEADTATHSSMVGRIDDLRAIEEKKRAMMQDLLAERLRDEGQVVAVRGHMGKTDSYVGTASLRWIEKNVWLFSQLPLFKNKVDEKGNFVVDEEIIEELRQRAPHWSRQQMLTYYLLRQPHRMFPPMLVVISEAWVDNPDAADWGADGRATKTSLPIEFLDRDGTLGVLDFGDGVTAYVIDGGHRLLGIKGVMEIVSTGTLSVRSSGGKVVKVLQAEEVLAELELSESDILGIEDELIGIEFVPAVLSGETREEARRRIRSMFVHTNKTAQPPTYGEQVMLDEDDGFSIVARRLGLRHSLLRRDRAGDRVNWKSSALPAGSAWLTASTTLRDMAERYLGSKRPYVKWVAKRREIALRPADHQLDEAVDEMMELLDRLADLLSFAAILRGDDVDTWREFKGKAHLLMRPLGQLVLAEAIGFLHNDENGPGIALDTVFEKLARYDASGGFEKVDSPESPWYGITYSAQRGVMSMEGKKTAVKMLVYLLNGMEERQRESLLGEFRNLRTIRKSETEVIAFNYDGTVLDDPDKVQLPPMI